MSVLSLPLYYTTVTTPWYLRLDVPQDDYGFTLGLVEDSMENLARSKKGVKTITKAYPLPTSSLLPCRGASTRVQS